MSILFGRRVSLIFTNALGSNADLSQMHITFQVSAADVDRPPCAVIKIFNLSDETSNAIEKEFTAVTLQAGYEYANFGVIFQGTIMMIKRGKDDATTNYLIVYAADGDLAFSYAVVNKALAAQNTAVANQYAAIQQSLTKNGVGQGVIQLPATGGILPRGKTLFGMARSQLNQLTASTYTSWYISNGVINIIQEKGYKPGEAVQLTAKTGLIGIPEATQDGIKARCLINPAIQVGGLVQLDSAAINQTTVKREGYPAYTDLNFFASTRNDGLCRVLVIETEGETRGTPWYHDLTLLNMDATVNKVIA